MISQTPLVSPQETLKNTQMTFDGEIQHYQRILDKIGECQEYSENSFDCFSVFADKEITLLMQDLQHIPPNTHQFDAKWRMVRTTISLLQSWQNRVHSAPFSKFSQYSHEKQIQIQELMRIYLL